jgi:hypothetical protein
VAQFNKLRHSGHRNAGLIQRHIDTKGALTTVPLQTTSSPFISPGLADLIPAITGILYKISTEKD